MRLARIFEFVSLSDACMAKDSQGMQPKALLQLQEGNRDVRAVMCRE